MITSGKEWKKNGCRFDIYTSLTDNPKHIKYEKFEVEEDGEIKIFKHKTIIEPGINISPFSLQIDHKERLTVMFYDTKGNANIGLEITYPKEIICLDSDKITSTETLSTHKLYLELVKRIKKVSKKAKAKRNNNISSPNFWISPKCIDEVNRNEMIKQNMITLK